MYSAWYIGGKVTDSSLSYTFDKQNHLVKRVESLILEKFVILVTEIVPNPLNLL